MALEVGVERTHGEASAVVTLAGELDASNYTQLIERGRALYAEGVRAVLLDLSGLTFLASSGLVALHSLIRIMRGEEPPNPDEGWGAIHSLEFDVSGGSTQTEVQLCCPQPAVERVLDRTGLRRLFLVHPDRPSAGL
jgi:anti-anti-sigma factor